MGKVKLYFLTFSWHLFLDFCFCLLNRVLEPLQWTPSFYWSTHICGWLSKSMFLGSMRIGITHFTTLLTSLQASPLILKCSPCSFGSEVLYKNAFLASSLRWLRRQVSRVSLNLKAWGRLLGRRVSIFWGVVGKCAHFCWQVWVRFGLWGNVFQKL